MNSEHLSDVFLLTCYVEHDDCVKMIIYWLAISSQFPVPWGRIGDVENQWAKVFSTDLRKVMSETKLLLIIINTEMELVK